MKLTGGEKTSIVELRFTWLQRRRQGCYAAGSSSSKDGETGKLKARGRDKKKKRKNGSIRWGGGAGGVRGREQWCTSLASSGLGSSKSLEIGKKGRDYKVNKSHWRWLNRWRTWSIQCIQKEAGQSPPCARWIWGRWGPGRGNWSRSGEDMTSPEAEVQGWPGRHEERTVLTALFGGTYFNPPDCMW